MKPATSASSEHTFTDIAPTAPTAGPTASFSVFPAHPHTGETVTLVSTSSDATSPISSYAWNTVGSTFLAGAQRKTTTFTTPGSHRVQLRVTDGAGLTSVASVQIPVSFPLMRPFPTVRIVTTRSGGRLHLKALTVEAPVGATVAVACKGNGCPVRSLSRLVQRPKGKSTRLPALTFPRLQRALPAGVVLEIRVTQPGQDRQVHALLGPQGQTAAARRRVCERQPNRNRCRAPAEPARRRVRADLAVGAVLVWLVSLAAGARWRRRTAGAAHRRARPQGLTRASPRR